jgi:hypothetical protein
LKNNVVISIVYGRTPNERIAIGLSANNCLSGNIAARNGPIFDDEWLAEPLGQPLPHQSRE